jgi:methylglutaconyl-CoA hydratase
MPHLLISPGTVTTITLNRPEVRNALNDEVIAELSDWAERAAGDRTIRMVILQGAGPVFCAGADLAWMSRIKSYTHEQNLEDARAAARMFHRLDTLSVPVIGRIHGAALGGGCGLAAICDIVVADSATVFGFTETTLGIVPAMIAPYVVRKLGSSAARALCLSGAKFPATQALALGLVHELAAADAVDAAVTRHVEQFLRTAPTAVAATKALLRDVTGRRPADVLALTAATIAAQRVSDEGQEGMRAFLEKRPPRWVPANAPVPKGGAKASG